MVWWVGGNWFSFGFELTGCFLYGMVGAEAQEDVVAVGGVVLIAL